MDLSIKLQLHGTEKAVLQKISSICIPTGVQHNIRPNSTGGHKVKVMDKLAGITSASLASQLARPY